MTEEEKQGQEMEGQSEKGFTPTGSEPAGEQSPADFLEAAEKLRSIQEAFFLEKKRFDDEKKAFSEMIKKLEANGRSIAGQNKKEESPQEYAKRIMQNGI